jgi:hypothetical protein
VTSDELCDLLQAYAGGFLSPDDPRAGAARVSVAVAPFHDAAQPSYNAWVAIRVQDAAAAGDLRAGLGADPVLGGALDDPLGLVPAGAGDPAEVRVLARVAG